MAIIRPFIALRPKKELASKIASLPYDVLNQKEAKEITEKNQLSFLKVTRSEVDLSDLKSVYDPVVYKKAKENLIKLISDGMLIQDDIPHFYLYKLVMGLQEQIGLVATFSVDDYLNDVIKKHEKTRKEKEDDRTNHIMTTEAQTGPVFLTYRSVERINQIVQDIVSKIKPEYDFKAEDGIKHSVWIIPNELNNEITEEIKKVNYLYIADGHHRAASAMRSAIVSREKNLNYNGSEEFNYFIGVLFPADQLKILPYNRVVFDLNGNSKEEFFNKVRDSFTIEKTEIKSPKTKRTFSMYIDKGWYLLKPNKNVKNYKSVGDNLDVGILQNYLLAPILGIDDPRTSKKVDFIGGIRGTKELEKLVDNKEAVVAFSLFPVQVSDLMEISDAGEVMPPKSTWFEPKLRDGLLVHLI